MDKEAPVRLRRQNLPWLVVTAAMLGLALLPGTAGPTLVAALLACGALALGTSLTLRPGALDAGRLRESLSALPRRDRSGQQKAEVSESARAASERARLLSGSGLTPDLTLLDIGLIGSRLGPEGMTMRKGLRFSGDDDGLRPYLCLLVPEHEAERSARLRFEIRDQRGAARLVHEQDIWLRAGQRDVLSENHLPLAGSPDLPRSGGDWELRVSLDAAPLGALPFTMTPSLRQRAAELEERQGRPAVPGDPPTLEELMDEPRRPD